MIDIIIPAYNCTKTLDRTLGSLVAQTSKNFKVYIIDDESQENIKPIADKYTDLLDITYHRNEKNVGCGMSRQVGIDISDSEYFMFLDSDDVFMPTTIELFTNFVKGYSDIDLVASHFYRRNLDGSLRLFDKGYTWCHGKLYKRSFFDKYEIRYNPKFTVWCDDGYLNTKCFELAKAMMIPTPTYIWIDENPNAITKQWCIKPERNKLFLESMIDAYTFILKHKDKVYSLKHTLEKIKPEIVTEEEKALYNILKEMEEKYGA